MNGSRTLVTAGIVVGVSAVLALGAFALTKVSRRETSEELVDRLMRDAYRRGPPIGYLGPE